MEKESIKVSCLSCLPTEVNKFLSKNVEYGIKNTISIKRLSESTLVIFSPSLGDLNKVNKYLEDRILNQDFSDLSEFIGKFEIKGRFTKAEIFEVLKGGVEGVIIEECYFDPLIGRRGVPEELLSIDLRFPDLIVSSFHPTTQI